MSVYFIKPVGMDGPVKIGFANHAERRLDVLQFGSPWPLEIAATIPGDKRLERQFHGRFYHLHSHNEWFFADAELTKTIEALNAGAFDFDSLPPPLYIAKPSREFLNWSLHRPAKSAAA